MSCLIDGRSTNKNNVGGCRERRVRMREVDDGANNLGVNSGMGRDGERRICGASIGNERGAGGSASAKFDGSRDHTHFDKQQVRVT